MTQITYNFNMTSLYALIKLMNEKDYTGSQLAKRLQKHPENMYQQLKALLNLNILAFAEQGNNHRIKFYTKGKNFDLAYKFVSLFDKHLKEYMTVRNGK